MQESFLGTLSMLGREAARIVLPSPCIVCVRELPWRARTASVCATCWDALPRMEGPRCRSCALPLPFVAGESLCLECSTAPLPLEWCDAWGRYRAGLERVLQAFKFRRHDFLDDALGELLAQTVTSHGDPEFDAIVPVPMSRAKLRRRGYNQAERLARSLAQHLGSECDERLLVRSGEEHLTQSTLPRSERAANVRRAFTASPDANGLRILIVDDICTTGETLRACATVLTRAKAATVCAVTVARVE